MTKDSCQTKADFTNRRYAITTGWVSTVVCLLVVGGGWYNAYQQDLRRTEKEQAEEAIMETLEFGRVIVNSKGEVVAANAAFKKWTRWDNAEGQELLKIIPEDMQAIHRQAFFNAIERTRQTGKASKPVLVECKLPRIDAPEKVTHVTIAVSVVSPQDDPANPYVIAYLYKTKALSKVAVNGR
jgi:PAS domain-containing protein